MSTKAGSHTFSPAALEPLFMPWEFPNTHRREFRAQYMTLDAARGHK